MDRFKVSKALNDLGNQSLALLATPGSSPTTFDKPPARESSFCSIIYTHQLKKLIINFTVIFKPERIYIQK